jgi:hypothetical protein
VSQSTPPNSSSDGGADAADPASASGAEGESSIGVRALVGRLAEEFGADAKCLARVAAVFGEVRERAPDLFVPAAAALAPALTAAAASSTTNAEPIYVALGEWALDAESEPIERMRRDCLRFQGAMTRGVLTAWRKRRALRGEPACAAAVQFSPARGAGSACGARPGGRRRGSDAADP